MAEMKKGMNYQFRFKFLRDVKWMRYALAIVSQKSFAVQQTS